MCELKTQKLHTQTLVVCVCVCVWNRQVLDTLESKCGGTQQSLLVGFVINWLRYSFGGPKTHFGDFLGRTHIENNI